MRVPTKITPSNQYPAQLAAPAAAPAVVQGAAFFQEIDKLSGELKQHQQQQQAFDLNAAFTHEVGAMDQDFQERKDTSQPNAYGFALQTATDYTARHQALLDGLRATKKYTDVQLTQLATQLEEKRNSFIVPALQWEKASVGVHTTLGVANQVQDLTQQAAMHPENVAAIRDGVQHLYEIAPGLSGLEKEQGVARDLEAVSLAAGTGYATLHAGETIHALTGVDPAAPAVATTPGSISSPSSPDTTVAGKIIGVESGGNPNARNPGKGQTASGLGQFTNDTWVNTYTAHVSAGGKTRAQIIALKTDPVLGRQMTEFAVADERAYLKQQGLPDTDTNIYLAHFLGATPNVVKFLKADPSASAASVLPAEFINANQRVLKDKTVGQVTAWAAQHMGGTVTAASPHQPSDFGDTSASGLVAPGNIDLANRQIVHNADGSISTELSFSIGTDKGEVLIPQVVNGHMLTEKQAIAHYNRTGENLGTFTNVQAADAYAQVLHEKQGKRYNAATGGVSADGTTALPTDGKTGIPALDNLDAAQRFHVLSVARQEYTRTETQVKAAMEVRHENATAAAQAGQPTPGAPTLQEYTQTYGAVIGPQKYAELQASRSIGTFTTGMKSMNDAQIAAQVAALKPKPGDPSFAVNQKAYKAAVQAAQQTISARQSDPAGYVTSQYPGVHEAWTRATDTNGRQQAYTAMNNAYDKLGVPVVNRNPLTSDQAANMKKQFNTMTDAQKLGTIQSWQKEMGPLFPQGMRQLSDSGLGVETYLANVLRTTPSYGGTAVRVLQGLRILKENPALHLDEKLIRQQFSAELNGQTQVKLAPADTNAVQNSVMALMAAEGIDPNHMPGDITPYIREALGGNRNDPHTGYFSEGRRGVPYQTILPPGVTENQFVNWKNGLTGNDLLHLGGGDYPRYASGTYAPATAIVNNGTLVRRAPDRYEVHMSPDGGTLRNKDGSPYILIITPQQVRGHYR